MEGEMKNILMRLRLRRLELRMKQATICYKLNKYNSWVSKIENGQKQLKLSEYIELCNLYKKDPTYFIWVKQ